MTSVIDNVLKNSNFVRVTGRGQTDAARNLGVTSWFLGIGSKEEKQEEDRGFLLE